MREFDQEPEELEEDGMVLSGGDVVAMGVVVNMTRWVGCWTVMVPQH